MLERTEYLLQEFIVQLIVIQYMLFNKYLLIAYNAHVVEDIGNTKMKLEFSWNFNCFSTLVIWEN